MKTDQLLCIFGIWGSLFLCAYGLYENDWKMAIFSIFMFNAALTLGVVEVMKEILLKKR